MVRYIRKFKFCYENWFAHATLCLMPAKKFPNTIDSIILCPWLNYKTLLQPCILGEYEIETDFALRNLFNRHKMIIYDGRIAFGHGNHNRSNAKIYSEKSKRSMKRHASVAAIHFHYKTHNNKATIAIVQVVVAVELAINCFSSNPSLILRCGALHLLECMLINQLCLKYWWLPCTPKMHSNARMLQKYFDMEICT